MCALLIVAQGRVTNEGFFCPDISGLNGVTVAKFPLVSGQISCAYKLSCSSDKTLVAYDYVLCTKMVHECIHQSVLLQQQATLLCIQEYRVTNLVS